MSAEPMSATPKRKAEKGRGLKWMLKVKIIGEKSLF
jgi:hypothetical protein